MNAIDLLVAYGLRKRRGRYFVSRKGGFIRDDADFEAKHPRDKDGKFASGGLKTPTTSFSDLRQQLAEGGNPEKIVREGAKAIRGVYQCDLPGLGNSFVSVAGDFVRESGKYFHVDGHPNYKKIAERQLFAYEHFEEILKTGQRVGDWRNNPKHHADLNFLVIQKILVFKGKLTKFTLDLKRSNKQTDNRAIAHNMSAKGNPGFATKMKALSLSLDTAPSAWEVIGLR